MSKAEHINSRECCENNPLCYKVVQYIFPKNLNLEGERENY